MLLRRVPGETVTSDLDWVLRREGSMFSSRMGALVTQQELAELVAVERLAGVQLGGLRHVRVVRT
jgi:hypothetical protein